MEANGNGESHRVLVVDDEPNIVDVVSMALRFQGFEVESAGTGARGALGRRPRSSPHLIVLDVMLPDMEGFEVAQRLGAAARHGADHLPHRARRDRGQDPRPHHRRRRLRDQAVQPRGAGRADPHRSCAAPARAEAESSRLVFEDLELDEDTHEVTRAGEPIELTATEYRLLRYLMLNPRRVLTRAQILDHVWDYDFGGDARVLETYISYLRKKLDAHGPPLIHTVRGVGYALRQPTGVMRVAARAADRRRCSRSRRSGCCCSRRDHLRRAALVPATTASTSRRSARRAGGRARARPTATERALRQPRRQPGGRRAAATRAACPPGTYGQIGATRRQDHRPATLAEFGQTPSSAADARAAQATCRSSKLFTVDGSGGDLRYRVSRRPTAPAPGSTIVAIPLTERRRDA